MSSYSTKRLRVLEVLEILDDEDERITFFKKWSDKKYCLKAVKQDGYSLKYVKDKKVFEKITKLNIQNN